MGNLTEAFVATRPREVAGSRTSSAYDYQKDWALCKLLSLHETQPDYLIVLDYHEDVVVFDSAHNPVNADFYQLKQKKSGNWTIASISKPKNKADAASSIVGKMFANEDLFKEHTRSLSFVSNQGISCNLIDGAKGLECDCVTFNDLRVQDKEKLRDCVHTPVSPVSNLAGLRKFSIVRTPLGVDTHRQLATGGLAEFFESLHPSKPIAMVLAYRTIFDEIRRKTNSSAICTTHEELLKVKSISKQEFNKIIQHLVDHSSSEDIWASVEGQLQAEQYLYTDIKKIKGEWRRYLVERMDANNELAVRLKSSICALIDQDDVLAPGSSLKDTVSRIKELVKNPEDEDYYSNEYIEAAIICEVNENDPVPKISAKPEEERT